MLDLCHYSSLLANKLKSFFYWPIGNTSFPLHSTTQWNQQDSREKTTSPTANYTINCLSDPICDCSKWSKVFSAVCVSKTERVCVSNCVRLNAVCCPCHPQSVELKHLIAELPLVCLPKHSFVCLITHSHTHWVGYCDAPWFPCGFTCTCYTQAHHCIQVIISHFCEIWTNGRYLKEEKNVYICSGGGGVINEDHFVLQLLSSVNMLTHSFISKGALVFFFSWSAGDCGYLTTLGSPFSLPSLGVWFDVVSLFTLFIQIQLFLLH